MKLKIYWAAKLKHAEALYQVAHQTRETFESVSRWMMGQDLSEEGNPQFMKFYWSSNFHDIVRCDVIVVYTEPGDVLRGALVEVGFGLAHNKVILVIGENDSYGTWQHYNHVYKAKDLTEALKLLHTMAEDKIYLHSHG